MPGIVGIITKKPRAWAEPQVQKMVSVLCHESFYVHALLHDEASGIYAGWVARKGSFADQMPVCNEQKDKVLIFSGEEYPDPEIRSTLKQRGHILEEKDPAYLVHLAEDDRTFPKNLNGRFQGLLIDRNNGTAMLFNDRFGMHRIYYYESPDAFYFAAEAKAILAVRPDLRSANHKSLGEFVAFGCALEDRTLFNDIYVLPTASAWTFKNGALQQKGKYFEASEWEDQGPLQPEAYYQQLKQVFSRNLPRYFNSPEKVGVSLTGGLDTRMIMAWWKAAPGSLPTYTFGGPYRECQDVIIARKIANICQQPHQVIPVGDDFLSQFAHYAERAVYLSDGLAAVNRAADLYANEIAVKIAPIRMTGNYGSEILRRLRAFKPAEPATGLFNQEFLAHVNVAKKTYETVAQGHAITFTAFRQAPWYQYSLLSLEQTQLSPRSPFLDNDVVQTAFRAPKSAIVKNDIFEDNDDCGRLIADGNADLYKIATDRGLGGVKRWSSLNRGYQEFTFKAEYAYDYGMPQWGAKVDHAFSALHFERFFLGRHKFAHFRVWYRDDLSKYVQEILLDPRALSRPYIQPNTLERMVKSHIKGDRNYTTEIHKLLTLELQHRLFLD